MKSGSLRCVGAFWGSSIGKKMVVAWTGVILLLFLLGHLTGNLLVFMGEEAFNSYAYFLQHFLHGAGVWLARWLLLVCLVLHVMATVQLTRKNRASSAAYEMDGTLRASRSSKVMIWSGLTVLVFVVYHLLHFTVHFANEYDDAKRYKTTVNGEEAHNAYLMVIDGFSWAPASLFYLVAITLLCSHLSHGTASVFQTLGLRSVKTAGVIDLFSKGYSLLIWLGFVSIPLAVWIFGFGR